MLLITHITIALISVGFSLFTYLAPSHPKLKLASWFVGFTVLSGTILVINLKTGLVRACMTGLLFVGFSLAGIIAAQHKLATAENSLNE
jgi:hypothetical protein